MFKISKFLGLFVLATMALSSCSKNDDSNPNDNPDKAAYQYVLMTLSDRVTGQKGGYITAFDSIPSGDISNITSKSLQGQGMGGFRMYNNHLFKKFSTADFSKAIERIKVSANGVVSVGQTIMPGQGKFGSGNFVIANDNLGFYWDADEPLKLQTFDPQKMSRTNSIDLSEAINERGKDEEKITFRAIGQKFLAVKNGKLFANITYATSTSSQQGFWDDFYPDVYIAVIDIATQTYEKTIKIENTGSIAYINANRMYDFDSNGDLYIVCQGDGALGGNSKIARIKADATDIDSWELKYSDINPNDKGKFTGVFAKDGQLIVTANTDPIFGGPNGNIHTADLWKHYAVDVDSKKIEGIKGIPIGRSQGASQAALVIDDKIYLRSFTSDGINGYFLYDPETNTATQAFNVTEGGSVSGFRKVKVE
ncbi:MAG TPA: hypothetical protein VK084_10600 [Chitinophagaceae bacterium]|nr:hypothetical protein [Chitinophagaceae bacterium]